PHLQLPAEPRHRPPREAERPTRAGDGERAQRLHRGTHRGRTAARARRRSVTLGEALRDAADELARAGVDSPRLDAELLFSHALGLSRLELYTRRDHEPELAGAQELV